MLGSGDNVFVFQTLRNKTGIILASCNDRSVNAVLQNISGTSNSASSAQRSKIQSKRAGRHNDKKSVLGTDVFSLLNICNEDRDLFIESVNTEYDSVAVLSENKVTFLFHYLSGSPSICIAIRSDIPASRAAGLLAMNYTKSILLCPTIRALSLINTDEPTYNDRDQLSKILRLSDALTVLGQLRCVNMELLLEFTEDICDFLGVKLRIGCSDNAHGTVGVGSIFSGKITAAVILSLAVAVSGYSSSRQLDVSITLGATDMLLSASFSANNNEDVEALSLALVAAAEENGALLSYRTQDGICLWDLIPCYMDVGLAGIKQDFE